MKAWALAKCGEEVGRGLRLPLWVPAWRREAELAGFLAANRTPSSWTSSAFCGHRWHTVFTVCRSRTLYIGHQLIAACPSVVDVHIVVSLCQKNNINGDNNNDDDNSDNNKDNNKEHTTTQNTQQHTTTHNNAQPHTQPHTTTTTHNHAQPHNNHKHNHNHTTTTTTNDNNKRQQQTTTTTTTTTTTITTTNNKQQTKNKRQQVDYSALSRVPCSRFSVLKSWVFWLQFKVALPCILGVAILTVVNQVSSLVAYRWVGRLFPLVNDGDLLL